MNDRKLKCIDQIKVMTENMTPIGLESSKPFEFHAQPNVEIQKQ